MGFEFFLAIWLLCAAVGAMITSNKNLGAGTGLALGGLLGIIGIIIAICLRPGPPPVPPAPPGFRSVTCTRCNAVQNVRLGESQFECWQCKTVIPLQSPSVSRQVAAAQSANAPRTTTVKCFKCEHRQTVAANQPAFNCEQCGQRLKRKTQTTAG